MWFPISVRHLNDTTKLVHCDAPFEVGDDGANALEHTACCAVRDTYDVHQESWTTGGKRLSPEVGNQEPLSKRQFRMLSQAGVSRAAVYVGATVTVEDLLENGLLKVRSLAGRSRSR